MKKTVLLTLGRLPIALDLARSFYRAGWRVVVAEPFGMHLARMSRAVARCHRVTAPAEDAHRYLADLARIVADEDVALVVPVSEESVHVAGLAERLPSDVRVFAPPRTAMLELHDKYRFNRRAAGMGLPVPRTALAGDARAADVASASGVVVKPRHSCSGRGVTLHGPGQAVAVPAGMLVQERLAGDEMSGFCIARDGRMLATAVYRGVVMSGSVAVCFERVASQPSVARWMERFVAETRHTGFLAFDFIVGADGVAAAIECNPRATSGIHFVRTDDLEGAIVDGRHASPRDAALLTESYSCFTAALGTVLRPADRRRHFGYLRRARDVSWSGSDPWPFLLMMINTWRLVSMAALRRQTFAEVAALDIEWREPDAV